MTALQPFRRLASLAAALAMALLSEPGLPAAAAEKNAAPAKAGDPFPALAAFGLEGKIPDLAGKVVLVDFWASWCAPCKRSFPTMKELHETYGPRGFLVLAISLDERKADMEAFLKKTKPPFPTLRDPKGRLAEALGVDALPTSMILAPNGKILAIHDGFEGDATRKKYEAEIDSALKKAGR